MLLPRRRLRQRRIVRRSKKRPVHVWRRHSRHGRRIQVRCVHRAFAEVEIDQPLLRNRQEWRLRLVQLALDSLILLLNVIRRRCLVMVRMIIAFYQHVLLLDLIQIDRVLRLLLFFHDFFNSVLRIVRAGIRVEVGCLHAVNGVRIGVVLV